MLCSDRAIKIVAKPWGFEFELFDNRSVSVWILVLGLEHKSGYLYEAPTTSEHLHVDKNAVVIPLVGNVSIVKDGSKKEVGPLDFMKIEKRSFHRLTTNGTPAICLEVECPSNRGDIIRKSDSHGRLDNSYKWDIIAQEKTSLYTSELRPRSSKELINVQGTLSEPVMKIGDLVEITTSDLGSAFRHEQINHTVIITEGRLFPIEGTHSVDITGDVDNLFSLKAKIKQLKKLYQLNLSQIKCIIIRMLS